MVAEDMNTYIYNMDGLTASNNRQLYMHCVADSCMHVLAAHEREEPQACVMMGQADIPHDIPYEETCCHHADLPRRNALVGGLIGRLRPTEMLPADVEHRLEAVECIGCLFIHPVVQHW